jgi:hypothetical protein
VVEFGGYGVDELRELREGGGWVNVGSWGEGSSASHEYQQKATRTQASYVVIQCHPIPYPGIFLVTSALPKLESSHTMAES